MPKRRRPRAAAIAAVAILGAAACADDGDVSMASLLAQYPALDTRYADGVSSCTPIKPDRPLSLLISQPLFDIDGDLPPGLVITDVIATAPPDVDFVGIQVSSVEDEGGVPFAAPMDDPRWGRLEPSPLPYEPGPSDRFALGALVEIPANGPANPEEPIIEITGFEFEVDGRSGVMPVERIAYVSFDSVDAEDFCPQLPG